MALQYTLISSYGGSDDTAYVTFDEANSIVASYSYEYAAWTNASTMQRTASILIATRDIDSLSWLGDRLYWNQRLEFLRTDEVGERFPYSTSVSVANTFNIYQTQMKDDVKLACALQALSRTRMPNARDTHQERQAQGIQSYSESVRSLSESYSYGGLTRLGLVPEAYAFMSRYRGYRRIARG